MNPRFRRRIASHNRHAVIAAVMSLVGAWLGWTIAYGLFVGVILGGLTVANGPEVLTGERLMTLPAWMHPAALGGALALLIWAAVDERQNRYHPASDRAVVGWHILGDVLLLPARLTFGFGHQLAAIIRLSHREKAEALDLLHHIYTEKRAPLHSLGAWFPDAGRLRRLLLALQMAGWIDLLRTEEGWIYIVRSTESDEVAAIFGDEGGEETDLCPGAE
ncbi:MAG: hypothetical protein NTV93_01040 [Verrucomicrobia bacterium]|nr:hypothetical protein [Verrucomicrobiota bacterium]